MREARRGKTKHGSEYDRPQTRLLGCQLKLKVHQSMLDCVVGGYILL
jgi:hypothetical protein